MTKSDLFKKAIIADSKAQNIAEKLQAMGLKIWEKHSFKRIYMTCEQFNQATGSDWSFNDNNNKIFYDFDMNAIMRSYKGKRPQIEIQF